jgi:signal transduction histidine kinase
LETLWIVDVEGEPWVAMLGQPPGQSDPGLNAALALERDHVQVGRQDKRRSVRVTLPLRQQHELVGALRVGFLLEGQGAVSPGLGLVLTFTLGSATLVGLFGYTLLRRRLIQPVQALQEVTQRIAGGEFGVTSSVDASTELADLAGALNVLSLSLASYRQRTRAQVHSLESANTELKQVQEELIRSAKLASVGRLAAGIAHEVGNPLTAVLGYTELLAAGVGDPELEADLLQRTRKEVDRIHGIIRDLLDYARPHTGQRVDTSVADLLTEAAHTVQLLPAFREIQVRVSLAPELPLLHVEQGKLHQVLVNLLINSADAMAGQSGVIELSARVDQGHVVLACVDDGPGIPASVLPKVFEPFFTTKEAGKGTGLGLALCQRMVESQGGWIRARNGAGGGAVIEMGVPPAEAL